MSNIIFRQLIEFQSKTFTYILGCSKTRQAIIIDPVDITAERDVKLLKELNLTLKYAINTHMHADHITGTANLKTLLPDVKSMISQASNARADIHITENSEIEFGEHKIRAISTPGHTNAQCANITT